MCSLVCGCAVEPMLVLSSIALHLSFLDQFCHWNFHQLIRLTDLWVWGLAYLYAPVWDIVIDTHHHVGLGLWTEALMLCGKYFTTELSLSFQFLISWFRVTPLRFLFSCPLDTDLWYYYLHTVYLHVNNCKLTVLVGTGPFTLKHTYLPFTQVWTCFLGVLNSI